MKTAELIDKLIAAETDPHMPVDGRRIIRTERMRLQSSVTALPPAQHFRLDPFSDAPAEPAGVERARAIALAQQEAVRVARMWGVEI